MVVDFMNHARETDAIKLTASILQCYHSEARGDASLFMYDELAAIGTHLFLRQKEGASIVQKTPI